MFLNNHISAKKTTYMYVCKESFLTFLLEGLLVSVHNINVPT